MGANIRWDFSGQVVLITGGARGQGRAHALAFAHAGADVAICDVPAQVETVDYPLSSHEELEGTAEEIRAAGVRCLSFPVDVRDDAAVGEMVDKVVADFGRLDVLVNNAGVNAIHDVAEMPHEVWDDVIAINLTGTYNCSRHAARKMKEAKAGKIVCTGSVNCELSMPRNAAYTASKHGVAGLVKAMAIDLAPHGINVNLVSPGLVDSVLLGCAEAPQVPEDYFDRLLKVGGNVSLFVDEIVPLQPEEVSEAVLWAASDSARFMTGANVRVDQGFVIA